MLELARSAHYHAYINPGVLLCAMDLRCDDALSIFDAALEHFPDDALLHFNRAVVLEALKRYDDAATAYRRCTEPVAMPMLTSILPGSARFAVIIKVYLGISVLIVAS